MNVEKKISLIKMKNKNTYPKNLILYNAIFYGFINDAIKISSKIMLILLAISIFKNTFYNFIYSLSFISLIISIIFTKETKKALNENNYKELNLKNGNKEIMIIAYCFTISFCIFLQLTIIEVILATSYFKFLLLVPYMYLYFMFEKGINYETFLIKTKELKKSRNNYIVSIIILGMLTFLLKIFRNIDLNMSLNYIILYSFVFCIIAYIACKNVIRKTFNIQTNNNEKFINPINNYLDIQLLNKKRKNSISVPPENNKVNYYIQQACEELKEQEKRKQRQNEMFESVEIYKQKEAMKKKEKQESEFALGLRKNVSKNIKQPPKKTITINEPVTRIVKKEEDSCLNRSNLRNKR